MASRIEEIRQGYRLHVEELETKAREEGQAQEQTLIATKDEILQVMTKTLRAKPSEATLENPLCDVRMSKAGPYPAFIDKVRAAERICEILGFNAAQKVEVKDVTPREPLDEIRARVQAAKAKHARN